MDQKQLDDLIKTLQSGVVTTKPDVRTTIDKVVPLPTGSKTLTGILGTFVSVVPLLIGAVPAGTWTDVLNVAVGAFLTLGGAGFVSKYQRQINIAEETLKVMTALLEKVKEPA